LARQVLAYERVSRLTFNPLAKGLRPSARPQRGAGNLLPGVWGCPSDTLLGIPQEWGIAGVDEWANLGNATDRSDVMDYETKAGG
jgi:hypothetical protein